MIIQLKTKIDQRTKDELVAAVSSIGYDSLAVDTQEANYLVCVGKKEFDIRAIGNMDGVVDIHRVSDDYKLVSRKWKVHPTSIVLGDGVVIAEGQMAIMAGPCSIESEEQIESVVQHLLENDVSIMRGGVYKPRSSPYSFMGLGMDGLKTFYNICKEHGIKIITEVMQVSQVESMYDYVDIYQVGSRNSQNFNLLDALGKVDKPVLIKRGLSGTIDELLQSAEYVFSNGNERLLLCERGIRTYEKAYRNTLDLNAVPLLKEKSHLPVIVDPSHGIGVRKFVESMALAGVMSGADGIIVEVHETPEKAISDGQQTLSFGESARMIAKIRKTFELRESL
jgi:3-deoxy-7-phosphoheptulonate synthase